MRWTTALLLTVAAIAAGILLTRVARPKRHTDSTSDDRQEPTTPTASAHGLDTAKAEDTSDTPSTDSAASLAVDDATKYAHDITPEVTT